MDKLSYLSAEDNELPLSVNTDPYIPLEIEVGDSGVAPAPLFWRLVDDAYNLISIGIDRISGQFLSMKIVFFNGRIDYSPNLESDVEAVPSFEGLPLFDRTLWGENLRKYDYSNERDFHDTFGRATITLDENSLKVELFPVQQASFTTNHLNQMLCAFNKESELIGITIRKMSAANIRAIKRYAKKHGGLDQSPY